MWKLLLSKLENYGFRGTSNLWFKNYLNGRKQFTSIRGVDSSLKEISGGVPQGWILGPILFLILINDLPKANKLTLIASKTKYILFKNKKRSKNKKQEARRKNN